MSNSTQCAGVKNMDDASLLYTFGMPTEYGVDEVPVVLSPAVRLFMQWLFDAGYADAQVEICPWSNRTGFIGTTLADSVVPEYLIAVKDREADRAALMAWAVTMPELVNARKLRPGDPDYDPNADPVHADTCRRKADRERDRLQEELNEGDRQHRALQLADRRKWLGTKRPVCPECRESMQIQLLDWICTVAKWKCRMCRHKFEFEPEGTQSEKDDKND